MTGPMERLPVVHASDLETAEPDQDWLIDDLWGVGSVGILGGSPKSFKTWLALDMAVSLASATPCLGAYQPRRRGRVLLFAAEDAPRVVRKRLDGLCRIREVDLRDLEIYAITTDVLRLDVTAHQKRLAATIDSVKPDLLILDPLVRMHAIDENRAGEVAQLLAYLRSLQRKYGTAIILVHHTRKSGSSGQPGQALRGSGDLHAFGDDNIFLRRKDDALLLTLEHRAAPSPDPVELRMVDEGEPHLRVTGPVRSRPRDHREAVLMHLQSSGEPVTRTALREQLRIRNQDLGEALKTLLAEGLAVRTSTGWRPLNGDRSRSPS